MTHSEQEDKFLMPSDFRITVEILKIKFRAEGWQRTQPVMVKFKVKSKEETLLPAMLSS